MALDDVWRDSLCSLTADAVNMLHFITCMTYDVIDFERYLILAFDESIVRDLNETFKPDGTARAEVKLFATYKKGEESW